MNAAEPPDVLTLGSDRRWTRGRVLLALALVAVLSISGYRMLTSGAPSLDAEAEPRTDPPAGSAGMAGPGVPGLPQAQRAPVVYAVGRTLHAAGEELTVRGPGVVAATVVRVRGPASSGWLVSLEQPEGRSPAHGIVDETGRFHPWPITAFVGSGTAILSPDGAEVLAVPAAFTLQTGKDHWELLLRARAVENQAFVVAPAQWGQKADGRWTYGRSMIVDPWGTVLAQCPDRDGYALATLDLDYLDRFRDEFPTLGNRRPEAYDW